MQHRINRGEFFSHYSKIFILLKCYVDFLQKLGKIEKVFNSYQKVDKQIFADMDSNIQFSIGDTSATVTDARGNPKIFSFTENTRLDITNGGHTTQYEFNDDHLITKIEYPEGNSVTYSYYPAKENERRSAGNLESVVRSGSDGTLTTSYEYETYWNQIWKIIDPRGNETSLSHDSSGNICTVTLPETPPYVYEYYETGEPKICGILKSITDPMGSVTEYTYYPESSPSGDGSQPVVGRDVNSSTGGYIESIVIDKGGDNISQRLEYDPLGNITKKIDGVGVLTTYVYDNPFGEVNVLTQGASESEDGQPQINLITTFDYDKNGNIIGQTSRGITTEYEYDRLNRLRFKRYKGISDEDEIIQVYEFKYDNNSNLTEIIYPRGNRDIDTYNERDLVQYISYGNDLTTESFTYTPNGYLNTFTDGENKVYTYVHDSHGRLKDIIDPLGNKVSYGYDENSNLTTLDAFNSSGPSLNLSYVYDPLNRLTHHKIQKGSGFITTEYGYNDASYLNSITTPNLYQWGITPTGSGLAGIITDPIGNVDTNTYDRRGWLKTITESESGPTVRELTNNITYNVLGNPVLTGDSIGRNYNYFYHHQKQEIDTFQDPEGGIVTYEYDGLNRLHQVIRHISFEGNVKSSVTEYKYDGNDNLERIIDADGNTTSYTYDNKDRLTDIIYPGNLSEHITYNGRDQILTSTDLNGTQVMNTYDDVGRLTDRTIIPVTGVEGPTFEHFEYDGLNRVTLASNNDSEVIFVYDQAGRLEREIQKIKDNVEGNETIAAVYEVVYQYDDNGNKTQITYPSGKVLIITPDPLDRIDHIKEGNNLLASYTYEGKGKVKEKHFQDILTMSAVYDDGRRPALISYKYKDTNMALIERSMDWDLVDLKKHDKETGKEQAFTYDSAYRLRAVDDSRENIRYEYEIDEVENVDRYTEIKDDTPKITGAVYNERHQLVSYNGQSLTYDTNGNLTHFNHDYVYNWKNQLVKVITGIGVNVEYKYDALGRRIVKIVKDPNSETETRYVHDGYQVIEERDDNDNVQYRYTYGNGIDERLEMEKSIDGTFRRFFLLHDSIGNVIGLTNDRGHLIERYTYTPFGEVTYFNSENAPEVDNVRIEDGKIKIRFNRPVILDNLYIHLVIKATQEQISGTKSIINMDRDIEFTPPQIPQNETLTITIDARDDLSGSPDQPIELLSKDFIYQGESLLLVHDHGPPRVERIVYEGNSLYIDFNERIDPASVTDNVEIEYGSNIINGSIEVTGDNQVKFTPSSNLSSNVDYVIRVKDIKDAASKTIEVFTYNFELNQQESLIFNLSILAKNNYSIVGNNSLMHGRTFEPEIGLYYYRSRYYNPDLGRFLQTDPMGYEDSMNLYQSFNQNPVNFVDPFGEKSIKELYKAYLEGGVNTLISIGLAGGKKLAMLLFPSKAKEIAGLNVNFNITDDKYSTFQAYIDKDMTIGKMLIEDLKTATIVYPAGKQLGEFTGNVYVGWFSDYSQEVKDYFQMESARGIVPTGVAVGSVFFATKGVSSSGSSFIKSKFGGGGSKAIVLYDPEFAANAQGYFYLPEEGYVVSFMGKNAPKFYNKADATLGASGGKVWIAPLEDLNVLNCRASIVSSTGHSPSVLSSFLKGEPIYGIAVPNKGLKVKVPNIKDAGINKHWRPGGYTGVEHKGIWTSSGVQEFVIQGGAKMPSGSILFKLNIDGSISIVRRF